MSDDEHDHEWYRARGLVASESDATADPIKVRIAAVALRRIWAAGAPEARGSLRDSPGSWPELCATLDALADITPEQRRADAEALARLDEQDVRHLCRSCARHLGYPLSDDETPR